LATLLAHLGNNITNIPIQGNLVTLAASVVDPDPDLQVPYVFFGPSEFKSTDPAPDPSIIKKNVRKILISIV
jgi:hypothetical protein